MEIDILKKLEKKIGTPSAMDLYIFCIQVTSFLSAGFALNRALEEIAPHQKNKELSRVLQEIVEDMNGGMSAAEAFSRQSVFPGIFAPTIESGEKSSGLDAIFKKLGEQMWLHATLYSKISSALLTPKIAGVMMACLILGFAKVIVPKYREMFEESGIEMPRIMEVFVEGVNIFFGYFPLWILLGYGLYRGIRAYFKRHPRLLGKIKLKLVIYKPLHFSLINYQFASNLALMLNSGLNVVTAMQQSSKVVDNYLLSKEIKEAAGHIQDGASVKGALVVADKAKALDPLVLSFVDAGEKTGNMVEMLERAGDIHKTMLDATVDKVSTKLTMVVIIPMGLCMVAMYAMSMVPMLSYFSKMNQ